MRRFNQATIAPLDPAEFNKSTVIHSQHDGGYCQKFFCQYPDERGHRLVVRNGYLPERTIQTGIGTVRVAQPRVEVRRPSDVREPFTSRILPPYLRRTKSVDDLIPWLYLKGISTQDFPEALSALLGPQAKGLSANTITRLKDVWASEYASWNRRSLAGKRYVYLWVDGIYFNVRLTRLQCVLKDLHARYIAGRAFNSLLLTG